MELKQFPISPRYGFTLVELLVVLAVIGVMGALIIGAVTNASQDAREVLARQQQVVLQEALGSWIAQHSTLNSLAAASNTYVGADAAARLELIRPYLQPQTYNQFTNRIGTGVLQTDSMVRIDRTMRFGGWTNIAGPSIEIE